MLLYIIGAGFVSVTRQVFWPSTGVQQVRPTSCADSLRALHERVEVFRLAPAESAAFDAWDRDYRSLETACRSHPAYAPLEVARHAAEAAPNPTELDSPFRAVRELLGD